MMKLSFAAIAFTCAIPVLVSGQGASFTEYGKGCPSSRNKTCPNSNTGAVALTSILLNNPQWALEVTGSTPVVTGFEIFTKSIVKQDIKAWIYLPDATGKPDHAKPLGTGTLSVDTKLGWYRATFATPVVVGSATRFFISWDQGTGPTPITADPMPRLGLFAPYQMRTLVNSKLQWITPRALRRWSWKILCTGSSQTPRITTDTQPALGNLKFKVLVRQAPAKTPAVSILGDSDKKWGPINLPLDLTALGAPGCSLLTGFLVISPTVTDSYGNGGTALPIPNNKSLQGVKFFMQWMLVDSAANSLNMIFSNGAACVVGDPE